MANFLEKIRVKTATEKTNKMVMKANHLTTSDFGQFSVAKAIDIAPCKGKVKIHTFSNMQPMPQPTFGEVVYKNIWYWIPYRTIFPGWNDFITDNIHVTATGSTLQVTTVPYMTNATIAKWFKDKGDPGTSGNSDYGVVESNGTTYNYFKHNAQTKVMWKLLCSLGIKPLMNLGNITPINIMRLLAVLRVYLDYYYPNSYRGDTVYNAGMAILKRDNGIMEYNYGDLTTIEIICSKIYYETDYFTGCWDNPNHPNIDNQESLFTINEPTMTDTGNGIVKNTITNDDDAGNIVDPYIQTTNEHGNYLSEGAPITRWALNTLKAMTDYMKRHQLAGADVIQRYLARFGVKLSAEQIIKSRRLGQDTWRMQVSPVFSNADTAAQGGESLGSYAGQAYANSSEEFWTNFETNEYGILLCVNTINPVVSYPEGMDGMNRNLTKLDFWTPEFDNIGVEVVTANELIVADEGAKVVMGGKGTNNSYSQPFGFLPRYARWKTLRDTLSGDYTIEQWKAIYNPYTLKRNIETDQTLTSYVHSKDFTRQNDADQFDRIFYAQNSNNKGYDNFNLIHEITLEIETKMKPLYDYYDWEHEGGQEVEIQNNGPYAN